MQAGDLQRAIGHVLSRRKVFHGDVRLFDLLQQRFQHFILQRHIRQKNAPDFDPAAFRPLQQLPYRADVVFVPVRDENSFHAPRPDIFQPWNNLVLSGLFLRRASGIHQIYMMLPGFDSNALSLPDVQHRDVQLTRQADQENPHQTHSCCKPEVRTEFFA